MTPPTDGRRAAGAGTDAVEVDVAVVGCGPVGATLAALLGQHGHRVAVVEATTAVYHLPRAAHLDAEALRIVDAVGVADRIGDAIRPIAGMHFVDADRRPLLRFDVDGQPTEQGWAAGYWFHQPRLEVALRQRLAELPTVAVHLGHRVTELVVDDAGATLVLEPATQDPDAVYAGPAAVVGPRADPPPPTDAPRRLRARWVVGCDGARSTVRRAIGAPLDDLGLDQPWLVVDAAVADTTGLPDVCQQICDPARPATFVPLPEPLRRWEIMLLPGESPQEAEQPDGVRRLLATHVDPDGLEVQRAVVYRFHALVAERWREGRVLLAGDAAHQMPPFLGQGMCSGLRDAANLAWRLDAVLDGRADAALLDGYQLEREAHVRTITERAVQAGGFIQTTDVAAAAERDELLRAQGTGSFEDGRPPALVAGVVATAAPRAGGLAPQPWMVGADGGRRRLDALVGSRWLVVAAPGSGLDALTSACAGLVGDHRVAALAVDGDHGELRGGDGRLEASGSLVGVRIDWFLELAGHGGATVVRPDRYVVGTVADVERADVLLEPVAAAFGTAGRLAPT